MTVRTMLAASLVIAAFGLAQPLAGQAPRPAAAGAAPSWTVDVTHSELTFRVRHLISRVRGSFDEWTATLAADPNHLAGGAVDVTITTASINTRNERRDNHLRSADFFDAENHPVIRFRSTRVEQSGEDLSVHGDLTIRGITRPVVLEGRYLGATRDVQGRERIGFEAETRINRHDFDVSWNNVAEGGGLVLGDEVTITIALSAVRR